MQFEYSSAFRKRFRKLPVKIQAHVGKRLALLLHDEYHPLLRNHALHGEYVAYRSVNVGGDIRILYRKVDEDTYFLLAVGTHSELYS